MIDITRSFGVFDPSKFPTLPIHIIGVGATGSHVCENLIVQGFNGSQIHIYDFDKVEEHNIANQLYTIHDIGKLKVKALKHRIKRDYDEYINIYPSKVDSLSPLTGIIFLLIDSSREKLFKSAKFKPSIQLIVETGIDARIGRVVTVNPSKIGHNKYFEKNFLFPDDEKDDSERSVCGTRQVVANTVKIIASTAVWECMKCLNDSNYVGKHTTIATDPWYIDHKSIV